MADPPPRRYRNPRQSVSCTVRYYDPSAMTLHDHLPNRVRGWLIFTRKGLQWRVRDVYEVKPGEWRECFPTGIPENASRGATHRVFEAWEPPKPTTFDSVLENVKRGQQRSPSGSNGKRARKDKQCYKHLIDTKHGRYRFEAGESTDITQLAPSKSEAGLLRQWTNAVQADQTDYRESNWIQLERA